MARLEPLRVEEYELISDRLCERTEDLFGSILSNIWDALKLSFRASDKYVSPTESLGTIRSITKSLEQREGLDKVTALSKAQSTRRIFLGVGEDEFLVFGHTHKPFIDNENKVANSGSWVNNAQGYNTYIEIEAGQVEKKRWHSFSQ